MGHKLVFKTKPRPHQVRAFKKLYRLGGGGLYAPMRSGKSKVAIDLFAAWHISERLVRVLIVCPNDVIGEWVDQFEIHCPVGYSLFNRHGEILSHRAPVELKIQIRNFESIYAREREVDGGWAAVTDHDLMDWEPEIVCVDEAHHIGNPSAKQSVKSYQVGRLAIHRLFMTGTPFHRKPFYVFGQFKFYDPSIFGTNFGQYKRMVAVMGGYGGYEVKRYTNLSWLRDKIKPHVVIIKKVPTMPPVNRKILFSLEESVATYREMEKENIVTIRGQEITAPIVLTRQLRLQQIAGGWLKTESGKYLRVGSEKKRALARRLAEYAEQDITKVVIGARFIPELRDIWEACHAAGYKPFLVHGKIPLDERKNRRRRFTAYSGNAAFISQYRASREGIDLSAADTMVFYSLPEAFLTYDQFKHRIEKYADKRTLLYEHLIAKGSRDEAAFAAMKEGQDVATYLMSNPDLVEQLTNKM